MSTPNLAIVHIASAQSQKEVTANAAFDDFDGAIAGVFVQAMADADQTPASSITTSARVIQCTGALTADRHLILPNVKREYLIHNLTTGGHNIIVKTASASATVSCGAGKSWVYCDGANNFY